MNNQFNPGHPREVYFIIGNGFDLEAGLPTSYPDFLAFIEAIQYHFQNIISYNDKQNELLQKYINIRKEKRKSIDLSKWKKTPQNFWYCHFKKARIQKGWIDFENEIAYLIKVFEEEVKKADTVDQPVLFDLHSGFYRFIIKPITEIYEDIRDSMSGGYRELNKTYRQLRDLLLNELNELITAFDFYLQDFIEEKEVEPTKAIRELCGKLTGFQECRVLTFNYTSTFARLIKTIAPDVDVDYCHVHGRIGKAGEAGNIVLGIDDKKETNGEISVLLAPFKKYYQRVFKETDSNYTDWLRDIQAHADNNRELYVFGHSIGITDTDILNSFIISPNMKTTVYSYDDKARADQIANMTEIIGSEEVVSRNAGSNKTLVFVQQPRK